MPILKIHKNALYVNNELVNFQFEIDTVLVLDSQVIVLIKTPYDIDNNDNVYSVDFHGKITWQIESAKKRFPKLQYTPYVGLSYKNGSLIVNDFYGTDFIVDIKDGRLLDRKSGSRFWNGIYWLIKYGLYGGEKSFIDNIIICDGDYSVIVGLWLPV